MDTNGVSNPARGILGMNPLLVCIRLGLRHSYGQQLSADGFPLSVGFSLEPLWFFFLVLPAGGALYAYGCCRRGDPCR